MEDDKKKHSRVIDFIRKRIKYYDLNLTGKVIYTEFGTGNYIYTPILALLANAKKVYAINKNSHYGNYEDTKIQLFDILNFLNIEYDNLFLVNTKKDEHLCEVDILTNSGFVRPIDKTTLMCMKKTAVIPLMWETWEYREEDLDLNYAIKKGILVLGTNESNLGINIFNYRGFLVSKLLFECGMGVYDDNILLIGSGRLGRGLADFFRINGINFSWFTHENINDEELSSYIIKKVENNLLSSFDAIVFAEHHINTSLLGKFNSLIDCDVLKFLNPNIQLIHICGNVDLELINNSNLSIYPKEVKSFGYMTTNGSYLSSKLGIELLVAGFKVGQIMSDNRFKYDTLEECYLQCIENNLIDDFTDKIYL